MPLQDPDELVVAGFGRVYVANLGATMPTDPVALLDSDFVELGYVTEDGVTLTNTPSVEEFMAWQSRSAVRRELTALEVQVSFTLEQWNADTVKFAFGGGNITSLGGGKYRFDLIADDEQLTEKSMVVEWNDGAKDYRFCIERGSVVEATETQLQRGALAVLPVTFKAIAPDVGGVPGYFLADDTAWDPTGS